MGGDSDTLAAIAGSIAWMYYRKIYMGQEHLDGALLGKHYSQVNITNDMEKMRCEAVKRIPVDMAEFVEEFMSYCLYRDGAFERIGIVREIPL